MHGIAIRGHDKSASSVFRLNISLEHCGGGRKVPTLLDFTGAFVGFYSATLEGVREKSELAGFSDKLQIAELHIQTIYSQTQLN